MPTAKLTRSAPYFPVADVARSAAHYQRVFGFQTEYSAGSPAEFAIVTRDSFSIMLRRVADGGPISPNERQGGTWDVFFWVNDVRALHAELATNGADVVYGPTFFGLVHEDVPYCCRAMYMLKSVPSNASTTWFQGAGSSPSFTWAASDGASWLRALGTAWAAANFDVGAS